MESILPSMGWIFVAITFLVVTFFAAFFQRQACGICGEGLPTFKKAIILAAITIFLTYLAWDFSAFYFVRFSKEAFRPEYRDMIHSMTYGTWFHLPLSVKTDAIAFVPMVNKLPYIFSICVAGICTVAGLTVTFRTGLLILVLQGIMTLTTFATLNFLIGFATHLVVSKFPKEAASVREKIQTYARPVAGIHEPVHAKDESPEKTIPVKLHGHLGKSNHPTNAQKDDKSAEVKKPGHPEKGQPSDGESQFGQLFSVAYSTYLETSEFSAGYLDRINKSLAPVSSLLPEEIRHFLESGGWWLFIGLAVFLILNWVRKVLTKVRKTLKNQKSGRLKPRQTKTIHLAEMPPAPSVPGDSYLTVKNIPGRVRVFVMSPAGSEAGDLHTGMSEAVADRIKPGLGAVLENDYPLIEVWNRQFSSSGFPYRFFSKVVSPDGKGEVSNWAKIAGTVSMGKFKVHVGMAIDFMERNNLGQLEVKPDKWLDILDVKTSGHHHPT